MIRKKISGFVLVLCCFVFMLPLQESFAVDIDYICTNDYKNSVYYKKLSSVVLTGDMRQDIVNVAISQIGYHEGNSEKEYGGTSLDADGEYTEYGYWYTHNVTKKFGDLSHSAWCAMFVSWCARQANISTDIIENSINAVPNGTWNSVYGRNFNVDDKYQKDGYIPQRGDLIFFDWTKKSQKWSHVGLVIDVIDDSVDGIDGTTILTVEGNSSDKVAVRAYSVSDPVIRAYGVPNYTTSETHQHTWVTVKETSCTESGLKKCTECEQTEEVLMIDHQYWNWGDVVRDEDKPKYMHIDKEQTCTEDGEKSFHCIRCGHRDKIEKIPAMKHDYEEVRRDEPTCEHGGTIYYVCKNDASHTYEETLSRLDHKESDWIIDNQATYFEDGKRHTECVFCNKVLREEIIQKLVDNLPPICSITVNDATTDVFRDAISTEIYSNKDVKFLISAKDEESGVDDIYYYISNVALSYDDVKQITDWTKGDNGIVSGDGKYIIYVRTEDAVGNTIYISSVGFEIDTVCPVILGAENNRSYCSILKFTVNEDCVVLADTTILEKSKQGYYELSTIGKNSVTVTDKAGNSVVINVTINDGHTPGEFVQEIRATCTGTGKNVQYCTVCNSEIKTEIVNALGHDTGKWETVKTVTCTQNGIKQRRCTRCDSVIERVVEEASGHILSQWTTEKEATCTRDGKEIRYCLTCEETIEEHIISSQGHVLSDWVVITDATCTQNGKAVKYCTVCHEHIREQFIQSTGHSEGNWVTESEPTCTHEGHRTKRCLKCNEILEEEVIQMNGHKLEYGKCVECGYLTPARWIILGIAVLSMIIYATMTVLHDVKRKRMK